MNKKKDPKTVIFLDVDGVLTSMRCNGFYDFDLWAVSFLRWACTKSGAEIVMSSAWRMIPDAKKWFTEVFGKHLHKDWRTTYDLDTRGQEIDEWLSRHPEVSNFVILDDVLNGLETHKEWLVLTTIENGMLLEHMISVKQKLGIKGHLPTLEPIFNHPVCFYTERETRKIGYSVWVDELQERNARKLEEEGSGYKINFTE